MECLILVIDADLISPSDPRSSIHIWYSLDGQDHQTEICGYSFHHWLPISVRHSFQYELCRYWYSIHPRRRDEHLAAYMAELAEAPMAVVPSLQFAMAL